MAAFCNCYVVKKKRPLCETLFVNEINKSAYHNTIKNSLVVGLISVLNLVYITLHLNKF